MIGYFLEFTHLTCWSLAVKVECVFGQNMIGYFKFTNWSRENQHDNNMHKIIVIIIIMNLMHLNFCDMFWLSYQDFVCYGFLFVCFLWVRTSRTLATRESMSSLMPLKGTDLLGSLLCVFKDFGFFIWFYVFFFSSPLHWFRLFFFVLFFSFKSLERFRFFKW